MSTPEIIVDGVWVPECAPVTLADFNNQTAANFNPASWDFYQSNSSWWLPGVILGAFCALGFLLFLVWLTALCCRRHYWKHELEALPASWGPTPTVLCVVLATVTCCSTRTILHRYRHKRFSIGNILTIALWLITVAFAAWGMAEGIIMTSNIVSGFWDVVRQGQRTIGFIYALADALASGVRLVNGVLLAVSTANLRNNITSILPSTQQIAGDNVTLGAAFVRSLVDVPADVRATASNISSSFMAPLADSLRSAADNVQRVAVQGLQAFVDDFYPPTNTFEQTWRWILIAVYFGLIILLSSLAVLLALRASWPRTAASMTLGLWLIMALTLLMGAGIMPLGAGLTNQSCLYTETFIIRMINERVANPGPVAKAMRFYMGGPGVQDKIAEELYNINVTAVKLVNQTIQPVRDWLQSPPGQAFINSFPNVTEEVAELRGLFAELRELRDNNTALEDAVEQSGFQTIYQRGKTWACCGLHDTSYNLWIAWTATGCAGLLLCMLLTLKIMSLVTFK